MEVNIMHRTANFISINGILTFVRAYRSLFKELEMLLALVCNRN